MGNMIPKIIHYCWFGKKEQPDMVKEYIKSWRKNCQDYEIVLWNEDNFDINSNDYVKEAYAQKKYAFVSDYVRLYALKEYGGIYFDTDIEVKKNLDVFLKYNFVIGFEAVERVATAVIMTEKDNDIIEEWLMYYQNRHFVMNNKTDETPNVEWITNRLKECGLILNGKRQEIVKDQMIVYEKNIFSPYSVGDKKREYEDSYSVHWCDGSWVTGKNKRRIYFIRLIKKILGTNGYEAIRRKIKGI